MLAFCASARRTNGLTNAVAVADVDEDKAGGGWTGALSTADPTGSVLKEGGHGR